MHSKPIDPKQSISVIIRDREKVLIREEVKGITSFDEKGIFDVLPEHENFISIIKDQLIVHKKDGSKQELKINGGVLKVYKNEIQIYLGIFRHLS